MVTLQAELAAVEKQREAVMKQLEEVRQQLPAYEAAITQVCGIEPVDCDMVSLDVSCLLHTVSEPQVQGVAAVCWAPHPNHPFTHVCA